VPQGKVTQNGAQVGHGLLEILPGLSAFVVGKCTIRTMYTGELMNLGQQLADRRIELDGLYRISG